MMQRILAQIVLVLIMALGPVHAGDKGGREQPPDPAPEDLEIIAVMEILKLMDLAKEMEMVKDMEHLIEENQNERTTD
jgi:hypothetical protein